MVLNFRRQIRRCAARQRPGQVIARQRRQRARYRLRRLLQVAAGAVLLHRVVIGALQHVRLAERFVVLLQLLARLRQRGRVGLRLQPGDVALGADNVHRLTGDFADKLRLPEPVLLLLPVKYRADAAVVGVAGIPVQGGDVLLLPVLVTDEQGAFTDPGLRRAPGMAAVVGARQHAAGHIGQQVLADRAAGAEAAAAVRGAVIRLVVDVAPAQRAGIKAVLVALRRAGYYRAVELGVLFDGDVIAAFARKQPGLLFDAVKVAFEPVPAGADAGGTG